MHLNLFLFMSFIVTLAPAALLAGDAAALRGSIDKQTITIGDPITYTISFALPGKCTLVPPGKISELGDWTVKDMRLAQDPKDHRIVRLACTMATFTTGQVLIPGQSFTYTDDTGKKHEVWTDSMTVTVESVLAKAGDAGDIRDIKPPLSFPIPLSTCLLWLAIIAGGGTAAYYWYRKYQKDHGMIVPGPVVPAVPPYQRAMEELEKLKASGIIAEGRIKEFYIALSDIIRVYTGAVYGIETLDRTTAEIYQALREKESDRKTTGAIKDFFDACDLVKFAKYRPEEPVCRQDWEAAKKLIEG